jgi:glycosyltransferase involved in cell wall biosynthesis
MGNKKITIIPYYRCGSFDFVAVTLCKFLINNRYNCIIKYLRENLFKYNDIVIFIGNIDDLSIIKVFLATLFSKNRIFYAVTEGPYHGYLKFLSRIFTLVVPSNYVKNELEASGLRVKYIIPHGIDVQQYRINIIRHKKLIEEIKEIKTLKERGFVVLLSVISNDIPRKGLKYLYNAIRITRTSNRFKLVIRGSVSVPQELGDKVIVLKRFLPKEDLIALYKLADACIVPSLAEGFGLPIIECFAAGKPVITLDAPPMNEINDNKTGWLVNVIGQSIVKGWPSSFRLNIPDIQDYAYKITECVDNDNLRLEKGINALDKAWEYHYEYVYKKFLNIIAT